LNILDSKTTLTQQMLRAAFAATSGATDLLGTDAGYSRAAVLVVVYGNPPTIIMTLKPPYLRVHAGEISFPGGSVESSDTDMLHTALRETREEIGLHLGRDVVVGSLNAVTTQSTEFVIMPFVAIVDDIPDLRPNREVERILRIPLAELLDTMAADTDPQHNAVMGMYTFRHENNIVWGATARILKQIRDMLSAPRRAGPVIYGDGGPKGHLED